MAPVLISESMVDMTAAEMRCHTLAWIIQAQPKVMMYMA